MMPPGHETRMNRNLASIIPTTTTQIESVQSDPPDSSTNDVVIPSVDNQMSEQQSTPPRFSILRESLSPVTLKFEDVSYTIKLQSTKVFCFSSLEPKPTTKTILNGASGIVRPGELLAMLGPSGSGKTTLLTALSGRLPGKVSGTITYDGQPFSGSVKRKTGFVPQDDILYPHLTVLETLTYAALLKLPSKLTKDEKIEQAELVIEELGLTKCRDNVIGGPLCRGVSGGERKRVSIGQEMLVNPSLLLLDEPTSGLDSTTAQRMMATLRGLARGGKTLITTIHQPSSTLYRMFDKVLVLSEGYLIYSGRADGVMEYFGSLGYVPGFNFVNPADFLLDLANGVTPDTNQDEQRDFHSRGDDHEDQTLLRQHLISSYKKNLYPALKDEIREAPIRSASGVLPPRSSEIKWTTSWWMQFKVLLERGLKERKHESYSGLKIFQVISLSILSGLLWWHSRTSDLQDQVGLIFFFSMFWGFYPLINSMFVFPQECPMLIKERSSSMYRLSSYYFARMAGDLPMELVLPTIFTTIAYWMGGLKPSLVTFSLSLLIVLFNVLVSQGLGLALGAIVMDAKQAATLASVIMFVFLLASGYYIQRIPGFIAWLKYVSFCHYCYKLLVGVQYSAAEVYECGSGVTCRVLDFPAVRYVGLGGKCRDVVALAVMLVGYRLLAYVVLRMRQPN
ncbi:ABC transporter G family member 21-like [Rhododendron vialii]|uniref:ABC transporter G family member 21-like n=1 Tax=Rhododendron vialii TaxID=182163 RepID=UPI00265F1EBB|nr:ABC transporter G family member 21-like [Rhododendron vialii]